MLRTKIEGFQFRCEEIFDEHGRAVELGVVYFDLAEVQTRILARPVFQAMEGKPWLTTQLKVFLKKKIVSGSVHFDRGALVRALFLIQVVRWKLRSTQQPSANVELLLVGRPWSEEIVQHANSHGLRVRAALPPHPSADFRQRLGRIPGVRNLNGAFAWCRRRWLPSRTGQKAAALLPTSPGRAKLAVEYYGQLNLDQPEYYSDLFFWQESCLRGENLLVTFDLSKDPLDTTKIATLKAYGISAVALSRGAHACAEAPLYLPINRQVKSGVWRTRRRVDHGEPWVEEQLTEYFDRKEYWEGLFASFGVKMYLTWFKHGAQHCAITEALKGQGGITAVYQRSFEDVPAVGLATAADIEFSFSSAHADIERRSGSIIPYHIAVGYLGDHRFPSLKAKAAQLRQQLMASGAKRIVAFCDENTLPDPRWQKGHEFSRRNYSFLLNKVLAEPWFGLIIKPKAPISLRQRLGPVAELLVQAERTGRCRLYESGAVHSSHPPALAALSADLMVHEFLYAATAGMESAIAGVPTLLMDGEGWQVSSLYQLGKGKVVFTDWECMWEACLSHWRTPGGVPGLGDWTPMIHNLDPFRDGRAAERMGTYLYWLLKAFEQGTDRESAMARAAERYCGYWGHDKISAVNAG